MTAGFCVVVVDRAIGFSAVLTRLGRSLADMGRPRSVESNCKSLLTDAISCWPCSISSFVSDGLDCCI